MVGLRRKVSLLLDHGHPHARHYPVPMLWFEAELVRERLDQAFATTAALTQLAISSVLSEKAGKALQEQIKRLSGAG